MSDLNVDEIRNALGSGAPDFPNGFTNNGVAPEIKYQRRTLGTAVTGTGLNTTVAALALAGLTIGKVYRVNLMAHLVLTAPSGATEQVRASILHDGASQGGILLIGDATTTDQIQISGTALAVFEATTTTVDVQLNSACSNASSGLYPDASIPTYIEIEELPYHTVTTDFTP